MPDALPAVDPLALAHRLAAITDRGACSDGERLAARESTRILREHGRRGVRTQTLWVRPANPLVCALPAAAGVAATLVLVDHARVAIALAVVALLLLAGEATGRAPLLSRALVAARATQNVVSTGGNPDAPVRLVVTASLDTPRGGLLDAGGRVPRAAAGLRRRLRGHLPGRHGLTAFLLLWVAAAAGARQAGLGAQVAGASVLVPALALLALAAGLGEAGLVRPGRPGANANASSAAVALALVAALDRRPPRMLGVDLVLAGAGEAGAVGLRRWIAAQKRAGRRAEEVVILHVAASGRGGPVWWTRDGALVPLRLHPQLRAIAARVADGERHLGARPYESRRMSGAAVARGRGWPAIAVGAVDAAGVVPDAGRDADVPDTLDPTTLADVLALALGIVARLDAELAAVHTPQA